LKVRSVGRTAQYPITQTGKLVNLTITIHYMKVARIAFGLGG